MKFKRLRLSGFKSFVDPTEMWIEDGLTGVVGPNGCGKSNLLEALRWVMGESSPKSLRGADMEDVIFAGTTTRPARNFADVALLLDNNQRLAPAAFNDSDEVEVARRIERDLGSAYRINGKDVRQKDVQLLFADAATGAHSPALVSQGRIGAIVTAKPTDRRVILEEAAGISGLHARRKEAEQRLRAAEGNITRLDDVTTQMETQAGALKRQARHAERYRTLSADLRQAEALLLYRRWSEASERLSQTESQLKAIDAQVAEMSRAAAVVATEQAELAARLPSLRQKEAEAAASCQRLILAREELAAEERRILERREQLERQLQDIERDRSREAALEADGSATLDRLAAERLEIEKRLATERSREEAARAAVSAAELTASEGERTFDELTHHNAEIVARKRALEAQLQAAQQRISRLQEDLERLQTERSRLMAEAEGADGLATIQTTVSESEATLASISEHISDVEARRQEADLAREEARKLAEHTRTSTRMTTDAKRQEALDALSTAHQTAAERTQVAQAQVTTLKAELESLDRLLAQSAEDDEGSPVLDQLTVDIGFEATLGAALTDDLNASVGGKAKRRWPDSALTSVDDPALPAGVTSLSLHVKAPPGLHRRLQQIGIVKDSDHGKELASSLKPGQRLVTLTGELWRWDGFYAATPANAASQERLANRNRQTQVTINLAQAEQTLAQVSAEATALIAHAQESLERVQAEIQEALDKAEETAATIMAAAQLRYEDILKEENTARSERATLEASLSVARRQLSQLQQDATKRDSRLQALADSQQRLTEDMLVRRQDLTHAEAALAELPNLEQLAAEVANQRRIVERLRMDLATSRASLDSLLRQLESDSKRIESIELERQNWENRLADSRNQASVLQERDAAARSELTTLEVRPSEIEAQRLRLISEIERAEAHRKTAADALAEAESLLKGKDHEVRQMNEQLTSTREQRARLEAGVENMQARRLELAQTVGEQFECPPPLLLQKIGIDADAIIPNASDLEASVERLRAEREKLGAVNLRADIELEELTTQLDAMTREREELQSAIAKLRASIGTLNREGRARLLEAFEAVNAHFADLFTTLFGGGQAHLELVESDDPLEAGLEIMASPPGKRLQSLSLLSGGEQALTATALIFAVFLTNPAPICVLDEVDAPLDDANVERFCDLLQEMTRRTQTRFLVVTHNTVTMSRMDRLYGVTMGERGVSQLVSVDLGRAERLLAAE